MKHTRLYQFNWFLYSFENKNNNNNFFSYEENNETLIFFKLKKKFNLKLKLNKI